MRGETAAPSVPFMPATTSADDLARHLETRGRRAAIDIVRLPHHIAQSAELRRAEPPMFALSEPVAEVGST